MAGSQDRSHGNKEQGEHLTENLPTYSMTTSLTVFSNDLDDCKQKTAKHSPDRCKARERIRYIDCMFGYPLNADRRLFPHCFFWFDMKEIDTIVYSEMFRN